MKKAFLPLLLVSSMLLMLPCCFSCTPSDQPEDEEPIDEPVPQKPKPEPGIYSFVASDMIGQWKEGDQIVVRGSYYPQTITFKAGDISADGKTATAELGEVTQYITGPNDLYAAWPASAVQPEDGLLTSIITYSDFLRPLAAAYLDLETKTFVFADAVAKISFNVSGGFTKYAICSGRRAGIRVAGFTTDYTSDTPSFRKPKDDGYPFRYGDVVSGETNIWFPGGFNFEDGFSIYFGDGDNWTSIYTYDQSIKLKGGAILELGDISANLQAYNGPAPKMPDWTKMTKYTVKLNELSGLCLSADGDFLWAVGDGGELAKLDFEGNVLESHSISGDTEGITINPNTGDLLIGMEANGVGIIYAPDFSNKTKTLFSIEDAKGFGNAGIEGITFYKDSIVYCGAQTGSYLYACDLHNSIEGKYLQGITRKGLREMHQVVTEIADLCYDPLTDWLWVIDSEAHRIIVLTGDGETVLGTYALKTKSNEESLCVDHIHSCVWVGDDYGSTSYLFRYDFEDLDEFIIQ